MPHVECLACKTLHNTELSGSPSPSIEIAAHSVSITHDGRPCGAYPWTMRPSSLDTFEPLARHPHPPRSPAMPRPAVQLGILRIQLTRENTAVVQGCVPFVASTSPSWRRR